MNLQPIGGPLITVTCIVCLKRGRSDTMLADLDGKPFKAYVHADECCKTLLAEVQLADEIISEIIKSEN
jgi:hypothetical protein